jgi:FixJ family two-component response regulator
MQGSAQGGRVAVVDDDAAMRTALMGLLRSAGLEASGFASAEDLLRSDAAAQTACVVTDVRMPGMSGLELQARLAAWYPGTPVVFITAHGDAAARKRALEAGARGFFQKPFDDEELIACVRAALDRSSTTHPRQEQP